MPSIKNKTASFLGKHSVPIIVTSIIIIIIIGIVAVYCSVVYKNVYADTSFSNLTTMQKVGKVAIVISIVIGCVGAALVVPNIYYV